MRDGIRSKRKKKGTRGPEYQTQVSSIKNMN